MRVLFLMSHPGQARNFESTLRGLLERGHEVELGYDRTRKKNLPELAGLAEALEAEYPNLTSSTCPRPGKDEWSWTAARLRTALDYMRYVGPEYDDAPKLRARAERFAPDRVRRLVPRLPRPARAQLARSLDRAERWIPISPSVEAYLDARSPDVVLVTPLLEPGSLQVEFLRAANRRGTPTVYCVASWDNLTNKGVLHEQPDLVTVWNPAQRREAVRFHGVPEERVAVTGAMAFDHWFGRVPRRSRQQFAAAVGLAPDAPYVLYVGSSGFIAPDEGSFVEEWLRELAGAGLGDISILARPHPSNPLVVQGHPNLTTYPPSGANPTDDERREDYFDSLYYSSAVVGVNTTAFLEAAILGRPVFTVLGDRYQDTQAGTLHFHHLLDEETGLVQVASSWDEHAAQLRDALARPHPEGCVSERSVRFTETFLRPHGVAEPSTPRMLDAIERVGAGKPGRVPRRPTRGGSVARLAHRALERERREQRAGKPVRDANDRGSAAAPARPKVTKAERDAARHAERAAKAARQAARERAEP